MYSEVAPANDAGAGILNKWANQSLAEYKFTEHSGTREVVFGDKVRADDGTIYQYMGTTADDRPLAEDYTDFGYWKQLTPVNLINDSVGVRGPCRPSARSARPTATSCWSTTTTSAARSRRTC